MERKAKTPTGNVGVTEPMRYITQGREYTKANLLSRKNKRVVGTPALDVNSLHQESARKLLRRRSESPSRRSASTAVWVFFQTGTARASNLRPFAVRVIRRPRPSAGSAVILSKPRRRKGLRAAVNVVRSIASNEATAAIPGGCGRFRDIISENCPFVRPNGRSASSKRRASALAARCT